MRVMTMQTVEEINAILEPETGWCVELGVSPHDQSEFLRLHRKTGKTCADKEFITSFPRNSGAGVIVACGAVARHYYKLGQASREKQKSSFVVYEVDGPVKYIAVPSGKGGRSTPPSNAIRPLSLVADVANEQEAIIIAVNGENVSEREFLYTIIVENVRETLMDEFGYAEHDADLTINANERFIRTKHQNHLSPHDIAGMLAAQDANNEEASRLQ